MADIFMDPLNVVVIALHHAVSQGFTAGLEGEGNIGVTTGIPLTIYTANRHSPEVRAISGQLWNVGSHISVCVVPTVSVDFVNLLLEVLPFWNDEVIFQGFADEDDIVLNTFFEGFFIHGQAAIVICVL